MNPFSSLMGMVLGFLIGNSLLAMVTGASLNPVAVLIFSIAVFVLWAIGHVTQNTWR